MPRDSAIGLCFILLEGGGGGGVAILEYFPFGGVATYICSGLVLTIGRPVLGTLRPQHRKRRQAPTLDMSWHVLEGANCPGEYKNS